MKRLLSLALRAILVAAGPSWILASPAAAEISIELATAGADTLFLTPWISEELELRVVGDSLGGSVTALEGAFATNRPGDLLVLSVQMESPDFINLGSEMTLRIGFGSCVTVPADSFVTIARFEVMATDTIASASLRFGGSATAPIGGVDPIVVDCEGSLAVVRQSERVPVVVTPAYMQSVSEPESRQEIIESGLLIVNGKAVEPPYELRVEGMTFYINGEAVFTQLPPADPGQYLTLPEGAASRVVSEAMRLGRIEYAMRGDAQQAEDAFFRHMREYFPNLVVNLELGVVGIPEGTPGAEAGYTASVPVFAADSASELDGPQQPTRERTPRNAGALSHMHWISTLLQPNGAVFWDGGYTLSGISESDARHVLEFGPGNTPKRLMLPSGRQVLVPMRLWEQLGGTK